MTILVVGSVAYDSVETPFGKKDRVLGGSATYFSYSASFFHDVSLVAVVGKDFGEDDAAVLKERKVDLSGLLRDENGDTFHWKGKYGFDLNEAQTLETHLNVFAQFEPKLSEQHKQADWLFLANIDPEIQEQVRSQVKGPKLVACDTMNFWIEGKRDALKATLKNIDVLVINDGEARMLGDSSNLVKAARNIRSMGPKYLVVKRGEYGVILFEDDGVFALPAYPLEDVFDPTGAGDTFAGGFMGSLARSGELTPANMRQAIVYGQVMASFNVEDFSLERMRSLTGHEIDNRYQEFVGLTRFTDLT